ncbi:hypothetical protein [Neptuniibacter sp.]|uniref:hypothetical protein n=1 Tax=Neptuniibacter sp. TaxID=1962643 RepID=UPI0026344EBB|nr:hypothetical protein [Neptuniibacter sp.]MCP4597797.1 hypothetical protein [Neptuniibacter sp.]
MLKRLDTAEIAEYMAYDMTCSTEWVEQVRKQEELEVSRAMTTQERSQAFRIAMGKQD